MSSDVMCQLKFRKLLHNHMEKIPFEKACNRWMILNVTSISLELLLFDSHISLPIVACSNNVSILHHFRDIITFTVYITARDLEKSSFLIRRWNYKPYVLYNSYTVWGNKKDPTTKTVISLKRLKSFKGKFPRLLRTIFDTNAVNFIKFHYYMQKWYEL